MSLLARWEGETRTAMQNHFSGTEWKPEPYLSDESVLVLCSYYSPQNHEELNAAKVGFWTHPESRGRSRGHSGKMGVKVGVEVQNFLF